MAGLSLAGKSIVLGLVVFSCFKSVNSSVDNCSMAKLLNSLKDTQSTCDTLHIVTQVLVREIEERVKLQVSAEQRISQLEKDLKSSQKGLAVGFSARLKNHVRGLTRQQKIIFDAVLTNTGGAYNGDTGEFRCPVNGLYKFIVTILSEPGDRIQTELIAAGESRMKIYSAAITYFGSGSNSVVLELEAGDTVYVRLFLSAGSNIHAVWSTFNGHLIREL